MGSDRHLWMTGELTDAEFEDHFIDDVIVQDIRSGAASPTRQRQSRNTGTWSTPRASLRAHRVPVQVGLPGRGRVAPSGAGQDVHVLTTAFRHGA